MSTMQIPDGLIAEAQALDVLLVLGPVSVPMAVAEEIRCILKADDWKMLVSTIHEDAKGDEKYEVCEEPK